MLDRLPVLCQPRTGPCYQIQRILSPLVRRHLRDPVLQRPGDVDLLLLPPQIRPAPRQPQLGRPDIGRQMLLMRHDDRASFWRALEDLDCRKRHAAGTIVEAFRNLSVRPDLAELDRYAEFLMSRLPPIEGTLIDAERVGHCLVGRTEERQLPGKCREFRPIDRRTPRPDGFHNLLRCDPVLRLIDKLLDARRDVLTCPQPVPMSSGLVWSTLVPRCTVRRGRAFPAGERSREDLVASIQKLRHRRNTTYRLCTSIIPQYQGSSRRSLPMTSVLRPVGNSRPRRRGLALTMTLPPLPHPALVVQLALDEMNEPASRLMSCADTVTEPASPEPMLDA